MSPRKQADDEQSADASRTNSAPDDVSGSRRSPASSEDDAPGGREQPKNDRRKRGDLGKRRAHIPQGQ